MVPSVRPRRDDVDPSVRPHAVAVVPSVRSRRAVADPSVVAVAPSVQPRRAAVVPAVRPVDSPVRTRAVSFPVSAMSDSQLQSFDSTSSCSYSQSFFSRPVPGVVSSSLSPWDSISPRPQAASSVSVVPVHHEVPVVPVSAFPLVRAPSSAPMVEIHIEFIFDVPEIPHSIYCECLKCWPIGPVRVAVPEVPPSSPSTCEVNVARPPTRCMSCVPGLYVCPAHLIACAAQCFICCNFCLQVLCLKHMYCPCAAAEARRAWVSCCLSPPI